MENCDIENKLLELSDKKYKEFHGGLCPGTENIIGVRVPVLRNFAKELIKEDYKSYLENPLSKYYEEIMLQGMIIGLGKLSLKETIKYLETFIPKIDNWAICDVCTAGLKITKKYPNEMWNFIQKYLKSDKEFEIRFGTIMMLDFYINENYIDEVLEICNKIKHEGYYVKMGIAWLISVAFIKFQDKTMRFLNNNNLDDFTYNKALQKIIESYRVDDNTKDIIRKMKRK